MRIYSHQFCCICVYPFSPLFLNWLFYRAVLEQTQKNNLTGLIPPFAKRGINRLSLHRVGSAILRVIMKRLLLLLISLSFAGCSMFRQQPGPSNANVIPAPATQSYDECIEDCADKYGAVGAYDQLEPSSFGSIQARDCIENCKVTFFPERYTSGGGAATAEVIPYGQECSIDADCVCVSNAPDKCGEAGQTWRCVGGLCQLR